MKKALYLILILTLFLSACGTFEVYIESTPVGDSAMPASIATEEPKLSLNSTSQEIQSAMLESATKWKTIWMDGTVTNYAMDGTNSQTMTREQVWIDLTTNRFRVVMGSVDGAAEQFITADGVSILKMDLKTGQSESRPMPEFVKPDPFVPTPQPDTAYPQPLWGQIGTPLSELAFTSDFAQNQGTFKPMGTELIADREAVVVEWTYAQSDVPSWRMWLDSRTAVILKMQSYGKGGGNTIQSESIVNKVIFDDVFANSLFGIPSSLPQFSDVSGQASAPVETGANAPSGKDALGELYFFQLLHQTDQAVQLMHLPGLCVVGEAECPKAESVVSPFPFSFSFPQLAWSPDGSFAAFVYPDNPNGTRNKLWLFDPETNTWTSLWEYAYIDPPMWSPDGEWIAFRQQDGLGGEDVMVIRRDGSDPKNLTIGGNLPIDGRPYVLDGWVTGNVLVHSAKFAQVGQAYLIRAADAHVQPMFETTLTKVIFIPSPDSALVAYDDYDNAIARHSIKVAEPDGANAVELTNFTGGSLFPIVWSPDSRQLAFVYYTENPQGAQIADVYLIDRDGKSLKQVYRGMIVGTVLFSPDGRYLLINEASSATGGRLFVMNLDTLEQRLIESPGLTLNSDWIMPSWRH